jgi:hypothetical protein
MNVCFADTPYQSYWTSGARLITGWTWTGISTPFSYTNWAMNEPTENTNIMQACVYLYNGYMYDAPCSGYNNYYYICEENCPTKSHEIKGIDSKEFIDLGGRTYYLNRFYVSLCYVYNVSYGELQTS